MGALGASQPRGTTQPRTGASGAVQRVAAVAATAESLGREEVAVRALPAEWRVESGGAHEGCGFDHEAWLAAPGRLLLVCGAHHPMAGPRRRLGRLSRSRPKGPTPPCRVCRVGRGSRPARAGCEASDNPPPRGATPRPGGCESWPKAWRPSCWRRGR